MATGNQFVDYFVVCGLGLEIVPLNFGGGRSKKVLGFRGLKERYEPAMLDHWPQEEQKKFKVPPGLEMTVLPGGLEFYDRGPNVDDDSSLPRSYPIVLTDAEGNKVYVWVVAFRDPVEGDIANTYSVPPNSYVDKCICLVSHWPFFQTFRDVLEEIHRMCFSPAGCSKPIWDTIAHVVQSVTVPESPSTQNLFAVENLLLTIPSPAASANQLPFTEISFQPLVQCLDVDHVIKLFTAVALERRVVLKAKKYELLTCVAESICHLKYPFKWMLTYIPVLPVKLLDLMEAPGSYLFGVCTPSLPPSEKLPLHRLEGAIVVDLDSNRIVVGGTEALEEDELPALPEPELSQLKEALQQLVQPERSRLDKVQKIQGAKFGAEAHKARKPWNKFHNTQFRMLFLRFFASILNGYSNFLDYSGGEDVTGRAQVVFNKQAFLKKQRLRIAMPREDSFTRPSLRRFKPIFEEESDGTDTDLTFLVRLFDTLGWNDFLENTAKHEVSLFELACEACSKGQPIGSPAKEETKQIVTIQYPPSKDGRRGRFRYDHFPALERTSEKELKRTQTLKEVEVALKSPGAAAGGPVASSLMTEEALRKSFTERGVPFRKTHEAERNAMVVDIQYKLFSLWDRFLKNPLEEESSEYQTIYALLESDPEGITGPGFMECIQVKMTNGWDCELSSAHFNAVKEFIRVCVFRASSRNNLATVAQALQASSKLHKRDKAGVREYVQRHIGHMPIWQEIRFWRAYFSILIDNYALQEAHHADIVIEQLLVLAHHMAELGLVDADAWGLLEELANQERISMSKQIRLRGALAKMQSSLAYFGMAPNSPAATLWRTQTTIKRNLGASGAGAGAGTGANSGGLDSKGMPQGQGQDAKDLGFMKTGWMSNWMGAKGAPPATTADRRRRNPSWEGSGLAGDGVDGQERGRGGQTRGSAQRGPMGVRVLRGHRGPITAMHAGTRSELGDLMADGDDVGYFISGSTDSTVKLWDPNMRGNELRATMEGHRGTVRCISSDRTRVISGGDDRRILVFDKATSRILIELGGHDDSVTCLRMLAGIGRGSVLTAGRDGQVKMSDTRSGRISTVVARWSCPVLCLDYLDHAYMLAAAGTDGVCHVWDVRAGKERYELKGHTGWIRSVRMVGDAVLTGSDDWTARVWTLNDGQCESVLACHGGPITAVEYAQTSRGIITGSADSTVRFWDRTEGAVRCVDTVAIHNAPILSLKAGDRWLAVAAADNSLSLFHRQGADLALDGGGTIPVMHKGMAEWQLLRNLNKAPDVIRQVSCDVDRGRICTGSRSGLVRVWDPPSHN